MPDLVVSNDGEKYLLDACVRLPWLATENWQLHLFQNNYIVDKNVSLGSLVEASYPGYAAQTLTRALFNAATSVGGRAITLYAGFLAPFLSTGSPQTVYGYYITVPSLGILLLAQNFFAPITVTMSVPAPVTPSLSLHSENEP